VTFGIAMFIALVSFHGLNELLDGLMLTERHMSVCIMRKTSENQPLDLSVYYKENELY
jgi:hypothetical protein